MGFVDDICDSYKHIAFCGSEYKWYKLGNGWVIYRTPDENIYIQYTNEYNVGKLFLCITHMFNNIEDTIQEMQKYGFCR